MGSRVLSPMKADSAPRRRGKRAGILLPGPARGEVAAAAEGEAVASVAASASGTLPRPSRRAAAPSASSDPAAYSIFI